MESADAFEQFNLILTRTETDVRHFVYTECSEPWCSWEPKALMYVFGNWECGLKVRVSRKLNCWFCQRGVHYDGVVRWD